MAKSREQIVKVNGTSVHVRRGGAGEPLLFLHGASGLFHWAPFLDQLAERFDVIAPDHPGYGRSDVPDWLNSAGDMGFFYLDFLATLGLEGVHLVGQSMGGWFAMEIAIRDCARLKSLTLAAPAGFRVNGVPRADTFIISADQLAEILFSDRALVEKAKAHQPDDSEADIAAQNKVTTAMLGWKPRMYNPDLEKWLHRITVPTHIVWGTEDKVIPPAYAEALASMIQGAEVSMIERASHLPHVERADAFVAAVAAFIDRAAA